MCHSETQCLIANEQLKFNAQLPKFKFSLQYKEALLELFIIIIMITLLHEDHYC